MIPFEEYQHQFADDQMAMKVETVIKDLDNQKTYSDFLEFQMTNKNDAVKIEVSKIWTSMS